MYSSPVFCHLIPHILLLFQQRILRSCFTASYNAASNSSLFSALETPLEDPAQDGFTKIGYGISFSTRSIASSKCSKSLSLT